MPSRVLRRPPSDNTKGHTDDRSLQLNPGANGTSSFYVSRRCDPGEVPVMQFYYQATRIDTGNPCTVSMVFYPETAAATTAARDATTALATGVRQDVVTEKVLWTRQKFQSMLPAPAGTRWVTYQISLPAGNARVFWVDDLTIA